MSGRSMGGAFPPGRRFVVALLFRAQRASAIQQLPLPVPAAISRAIVPADRGAMSFLVLLRRLRGRVLRELRNIGSEVRGRPALSLERA